MATTKTKPVHGAFSKILSKPLLPVTEFLSILGFLVSEPCNPNANKNARIVRNIIRVVLRGWLLVCIYTSIKQSQKCSKFQGKRNFFPECQPLPYRINVGDLAFGFCCFLVLNLFEDRLARFCGNRIREMLDHLDALGGTKTLRKLLFAASVALALVSVLAALLVSVALTNLKKVFVTLLSTPLYSALKIHKNFCLLPLRLLSVLFCVLYLLACSLLAYVLGRFSVVCRNSPPSLEVLQKHQETVSRYVLSLNGVYSDVLPLLYVFNVYSILVWTHFTCDTKDHHHNCCHFFIYVLEFVCIAVVPVVVNAKLKPMTCIGIADFKRSVIKEVALPEIEAPPQNIGSFPTSMSTSQPPKLTAGQSPISSWIIVKYLVAVVLVFWIHFNMEWLKTQLSATPKR